MAENAKIVNIAQVQDDNLVFRSGRQIRVKENYKEEILEIIEPEGNVSLKITLTDTGPLISVSGARLELNSTESITLDSKRIEINASEKAVIKTTGELHIESAEQMDVKSNEDIVVAGKMVYIN